MLQLDEILSLDNLLLQENETSELQDRIKKYYTYVNSGEKTKETLRNLGKICEDDVIIDQCEDLHCSICSQLFTDPIIDCCSADHPHTFCRKCLMGAF
jgi:hypothetical protein